MLKLDKIPKDVIEELKITTARCPVEVVEYRKGCYGIGELRESDVAKVSPPPLKQKGITVVNSTLPPEEEVWDYSSARKKKFPNTVPGTYLILPKDFFKEK
jgi:hypothetical protein